MLPRTSISSISSSLSTNPYSPSADPSASPGKFRFMDAISRLFTSTGTTTTTSNSSSAAATAAGAFAGSSSAAATPASVAGSLTSSLSSMSSSASLSSAFSSSSAAARSPPLLMAGIAESPDEDPREESSAAGGGANNSSRSSSRAGGRRRRGSSRSISRSRKGSISAAGAATEHHHWQRANDEAPNSWVGTEVRPTARIGGSGGGGGMQQQAAAGTAAAGGVVGIELVPPPLSHPPEEAESVPLDGRVLDGRVDPLVRLPPLPPPPPLNVHRTDGRVQMDGPSQDAQQSSQPPQQPQQPQQQQQQQQPIIMAAAGASLTKSKSSLKKRHAGDFSAAFDLDDSYPASSSSLMSVSSPASKKSISFCWPAAPQDAATTTTMPGDEQADVKVEGGLYDDDDGGGGSGSGSGSTPVNSVLAIDIPKSHGDHRPRAPHGSLFELVGVEGQGAKRLLSDDTQPDSPLPSAGDDVFGNAFIPGLDNPPEPHRSHLPRTLDHNLTPATPATPATPGMAGVTVEEYFIEHWVPSSSLADYPTEFLDAVVPDDPYLRDFLAGNCETSTRTITSSGDVFYTFASFPLRSPGSQSAESIAETEPASPMVESSHFPTYFRDTGADDGASFSDEQNALENSQVVDDLPLPLRFEDDDLLVVNPNRATLIHRKPIFAFDDIANDFGTLNSLSRPRRRRHMSDATTILDSPIQDEQDDEDDDNDSEVHASAGHRAESVGAIHNSTPPLSPETDLAQPHPAQDGMVFPQGFPHRASPTGSGAQSDMHVRRDQDAYLSASVSSSAHFQQPTATPRYHRLSSLYRGTPSASSSSSASDRLGSFGSHSDDLTRVITRVVTLERKGRKSVVRVVSMIQAEPPASATTPRSFDFPDGATARSYPSLSRSVRHDAPAPSVTGVTEGSSQLRATRSRDLSQIDPNEGASEVVDPVQSGTPSEALGAGGGYDDREKSLSIFPPASSSSAAASASIGQKRPKSAFSKIFKLIMKK